MRGQGIARVNALSRCWSCLITSYQLKGKRRDARERMRARRQERRRERRNRIMARELCSEAFDCGDSEFLVELHRPSCSLARFLSPPSLPRCDSPNEGR